jgi:hypothetical protein
VDADNRISRRYLQIFKNLFNKVLQFGTKPGRKELMEWF